MAVIKKSLNENAILKLLLTLEGAGIPSLSPSIEIRRRSDDKFLDFDATVTPFFVASGGSKEKTMVESTFLAGLYEHVFDPNAVGETTQEEYLMIYRSNSVDFPFIDIDEFLYESGPDQINTDLALIIKLLDNDNSLDALSTTKYEYIIFDDDGTTPIRKYDIERVDADSETRKKTLP